MELGALTENLNVVLPELILVIGAMIVMMVDVFSGRRSSSTLSSLSVVVILAAMAATLLSWGQPAAIYLAGVVSDGFALSVRLIVLIAVLFGTLLSADYLPVIREKSGEYYSLLLLCAAGMTLMGSATDLMILFIALEIFSLALYILSGFYVENARSTEAAMKYFLLGAFASSFLVYGAALLYGAAGTINLVEIGAVLGAGTGNSSLVLPGIALLIVGFGFKISMVPFHMWTPDVYQGAPTPVTAFMSVGTKTAAFAAFLRVMMTALPSQHESWGMGLAILAAITMSVGNLTALRQDSVKRMLAYSSVAHAGYLLVGLVPGSTDGSHAAIFYLFAYAFMNIGAFIVIIAVERSGEGDVEQNVFAGLGKRKPLLAAAMTIFMLSLSGIPPLAGFFGKFLVFKTAIEGGWDWLVVVGVINSAISAYYYLRVVVNIYFGESSTTTPTRSWAGLNFSLAVTALATVIIGLYPGVWINLLSGLGG